MAYKTKNMLRKRTYRLSLYHNHTNHLQHHLCVSLTVPTEEFLFEDAGSYAFMSNGYVAVPGINDTNEYEDTVEAMKIMGMPEEEQSGEPCG